MGVRINWKQSDSSPLLAALALTVSLGSVTAVSRIEFSAALSALVSDRSGSDRTSMVVQLFSCLTDAVRHLTSWRQLNQRPPAIVMPSGGDRLAFKLMQRPKLSLPVGVMPLPAAPICPHQMALPPPIAMA